MGVVNVCAIRKYFTRDFFDSFYPRNFNPAEISLHTVCALCGKWYRMLVVFLGNHMLLGWLFHHSSGCCFGGGGSGAGLSGWYSIVIE